MSVTSLHLPTSRRQLEQVLFWDSCSEYLDDWDSWSNLDSQPVSESWETLRLGA